VDAALQHLRTWTARRWLVAAAASVVVALLVGLPTDVIPNPVFGRPVPVTWWSYPVLVVTALLGGLLAATYVREPGTVTTTTTTATGSTADDERPARRGGVAGLLSFFAVGCPVCNKLVVIALGTVGARQWFEPIQPLLALVSIVLMAVALRTRLRFADACPIGPVSPA
jgi:MFS family permease